MKIQYEIAGGHKRGPNGLSDYLNANPGLPQNEAAAQWIDGKFGTWINAQIGSDFVISNQDTVGFVIDFLHDTDALAFVEKLGGRVLEE